MRNFTFKGLFLAGLFMVLGCLSIQAADDLITKQITIKLDEAGTLPDKIGSTKKYQITNLKIIGEINGTDLRFIRNMAGGIDFYDETLDFQNFIDQFSGLKTWEEHFEELKIFVNNNDSTTALSDTAALSATAAILATAAL